LNTCVEAILEILELTKRAIQDNDLDAVKRVEPLEEAIDILIREVKSHHIQRVQAGNCTLELGFVFNDCLNNFERVADHCSNIAVAVLESADSHVHAHDYLRTIKEDVGEEFRTLVNEYANKYYIEFAGDK